MKLTNVGNTIRELNNQIMIKGVSHVDLLKKAGIEIISTLSSGRGTSYFINEDDVEFFKKWLLQTYPKHYARPLIEPTLSATDMETLSKLQKDVSDIFQQVQLINKKLDLFTENLLNYIDKQSPQIVEHPVPTPNECDPQFLKEFTDSWKTTVKSLGLAGLSQQLALNTNVMRVWKDKDKYIIHLEALIPRFVTPNIAKTFTSALAKHLKLPVHLTIYDRTGEKNELHSSFH